MQSSSLPPPRPVLLFKVGVLVLVAFSLSDLLSGHAGAVAAALVRGAWASTFLALWFLCTRTSDAAWRGLLVATAAGCIAAQVALTMTMASRYTSNLTWLMAMPLAIGVAMRHEVRAVAAASVVAVPLGLVAVLTSGAVASEAARWGLAFACSGAIATAGAFVSRREYGQRTEAVRREVEAATRVTELTTQVDRSDRLSAVGKMAAGVAHEINNPLAAVRSTLTYLLEDLPTRPGVLPDDVEMVKECADSVDHIAAIVADLKNFSREQQQLTAVTSVEEVIQETVKLARFKTRGVAEVHVAIDATVPPVRMSRQRLSQVLLNLLVNAADALEEQRASRKGSAGGNIWLKVRTTAEGVEVAVEDDGAGIPPETLDNLFQPFFTTKPIGKGTGLGLSVSRDYMRQFGGDLRYQRGEAPGACFVVQLQAA